MSIFVPMHKYKRTVNNKIKELAEGFKPCYNGQKFVKLKIMCLGSM